MDLTGKQQLVLDYIVQFRKDYGYSPSLKDIADQFGFASRTASVAHIDALVKKGALRRDKRISRGIVPT
jgi:repressor LexA